MVFLRLRSSAAVRLLRRLDGDLQGGLRPGVNVATSIFFIFGPGSLRGPGIWRKC